MAVAPKTLEAAARWLRFLRRGPIAQARSYLTSDPTYLDLTRGQYDNGLDLITDLGLYTREGGLRVDYLRSSEEQCRVLLASSVIAAEAPVWLEDPYIGEAFEDPPEDALAVFKTLGINEAASSEVMRRAYGKVDLETRAAVGLAGEEALGRLLLGLGAEAVGHVSTYDDGAGFDLRVMDGSEEFHLEVKTTTKKRSLRIYLSRNEFEVAQDDDAWRLVVVGLTQEGEVGALSTLDSSMLLEHAPTDNLPVGSWASAKMLLGPQHLSRGLQLSTIAADGTGPQEWWTEGLN